MTQELLHIDAQVRQASTSWARFLELVRTDIASAKRLDPFAATRQVTGQSLLLELRAYKPTATQEDLHKGLMRWVYALLQARMSIPFVLEARSLREALVSVPVFGESLSSRALFRAALLEPVNRAAEYVKILNDRAPELSSVEARAREVRFEVARLLGHTHPDEPLLREDEATDFDKQFVRETLDLAKDTVRSDQAVSPEATYARRELATDAREGWPARLNDRWYDEVFSGLGGTIARLGLQTQSSRDVWGAASFGRALARLGLAMRAHYLYLSKLPIAARAHPENLEGQLLGCAFALLLASPAFHARALGLGRVAARDQARLCTRSLLLSLRRAHASVATVRGDWSVDEAANVTYCGADPSPLMRSLLVHQPKIASAPLGISFSVLMVNRFDEDWFRNPRAHRFLIDRAGAPAFATDRTSAMSAVECRQWFESRV